MEQKATVIRLQNDGLAELRVRRSSACGSCHNCANSDACALQEQSLTVLAENPTHAQPGDIVTVETSTGKVLLTAVVVYLLPLLFFLAGYLLGETLNFYPAYTAAGAFILAGLIAVLYNHRVAKKKSIRYTITGIEKE